MARSLFLGVTWNISRFYKSAMWLLSSQTVICFAKASLRYKYAFFNEEFSFLPFIFRLCMCNFYALAEFLSDYLAFYNPLLYMSSDLLYLIFRTKNFDLLLHALKFRQGFYDWQDPNFTYRKSVTELGFR